MLPRQLEELRKKNQSQFEEYMHKLEVMKNYLDHDEAKRPNLRQKIVEIQKDLHFFDKTNSENKKALSDRKVFTQKLRSTEQSTQVFTSAETSELKDVIQSLQGKRSDNNEDKNINYQWIRECFRELQAKTSFISFFKDFMSYIRAIGQTKPANQGTKLVHPASNAPVFFKPPAPVWTRVEEKEVLAQKGLESIAGDKHKDDRRALKEKYSLQPRGPRGK